MMTKGTEGTYDVKGSRKFAIVNILGVEEISKYLKTRKK